MIHPVLNSDRHAMYIISRCRFPPRPRVTLYLVFETIVRQITGFRRYTYVVIEDSVHVLPALSAQKRLELFFSVKVISALMQLRGSARLLARIPVSYWQTSVKIRPAKRT